jgi:hypothetical protein
MLVTTIKGPRYMSFAYALILAGAVGNLIDRYTLGYVDGYLHDGREMLREAKRRRQWLQEERRRLEL